MCTTLKVARMQHSHRCLSCLGNDRNNSNNEQRQKRHSNRSLSDQGQSDEMRELDSDYKDVFMRRLATDMQSASIQSNDLRRRFGLNKETLETLIPEYKLLLNRPDLDLFRYSQEVLTARYLHSMRIDSDTVIESSSSSHKLVEVEPEAAEAAQIRLEAHGQRWHDVQEQRLHKASRSKLDNVMELIRTEDRPVSAFPDGQPPSVSSEADETALITGDRGGGGGGGPDGV